jgi:hypothetical protein
LDWIICLPDVDTCIAIYSESIFLRI